MISPIYNLIIFLTFTIHKNFYKDMIYYGLNSIIVHLTKYVLNPNIFTAPMNNLTMFLIGGCLSRLLGKSIKLWRGEGNIMAVGKNITWRKGKWSVGSEKMFRSFLKKVILKKWMGKIINQSITWLSICAVPWHRRGSGYPLSLYRNKIIHKWRYKYCFFLSDYPFNV